MAAEEIQSYISELQFIIPELILAVGILIVLLADLLIGKKNIQFYLSLLVILGSIFSLFLFEYSNNPIFFKAIFPSQGTVFFRVLLDITMLPVLYFWYVSKIRMDKNINSEYPYLFISVLFAAHVLSLSNSWLMVFLSIEMLSICSYILVGMGLGKINTEASFKYLVFGALSTGIMLFGISLIFASTGNLFFSGFSFSYSGAFQEADLLSIGLIMAFAGIFFKLSLFPFHFWAPDVYQGTSLSIMTMISTIPKIAAFGFFAAQFIFIWPVSEIETGNFSVILGGLAILSLLWGNLSALRQKNFSRMMAYSGIAQNGFMLLALLNGYTGILNLEIFLSLYVLMNLIVFFTALMIPLEAYKIELNHFSGLGKSHLFISLSLLLAFVALIGLPPTSGFTAKFLILTGVFEWYSNQSDILSISIFILAVINILISLFYYLRIPFYMYFREAVIEKEEINYPVKSIVFVSSLILLASFFLFKFYKEFIIFLGADII